jgi:phenylpyruvate tautomerase PptA (4-oxalocrotonate tautomerase family)
LHERVSRQVLEAEGAQYEGAAASAKAQAITWMLIHEIPDGGWSVGSKVLSANEPRVFTRVSVPPDSLNDERRADVVARVNREIVDALGEEYSDPMRNFCLVDESSTFSGGGIIVNFEQLIQWLELDLGDREPVAAG